jgi:hypothetical protein
MFQLNLASERSSDEASSQIYKKDFNEQEDRSYGRASSMELFKSQSAPSKLTSLANILLNAFVFTPLTICYWTSTWDLLYLYIFPDNLWLSLSCTCVVTNVILVLAYLFQETIQKKHDTIRNKKFTISLSGINYRYYGIDFLYRCVYTYVLTVAYVSQWKTYWDLYNELTKEASYLYFVLISFIALAAYKLVLGRSLKSLIKTVPFHLEKDLNFESYFMQSKPIVLKSVSAFYILNRLEAVIMLIDYSFLL